MDVFKNKLRLKLKEWGKTELKLNNSEGSKGRF